MNRITKKIFLCLFALLLCFLSYKFCYLIAERFFFDKFFYQKSVKYGYWVPHQISHLSHSNFGERAKDIYDLQTNYPNELLNDNGQVFKIALYGDSYVWGQGITNEQRFAKILEAKLNKIRPTRIFSLAETGDNIFDHYQKYQNTAKVFGRIDLNIFGLNFNDLIFNNINDLIYDRYHTSSFLKSNLFSKCTGPEIYADNSRDVLTESFNENTKNYCAFQKVITLFPKEKSLYFNLSELTDSGPFQVKFNQIIEQSHLPFFNPYTPDFLTATHPNKYNLSTIDNHPSAIANQLYADILYQEITTNPKWGFIK